MVFSFFGSDELNSGGRRFTEPKLTFSIEEKDYEAVDWSSEGCRIAGFSGGRKKGSRIIINAITPRFRETVYVFLQGRVAWQSRTEKTLSIQFETLCDSSKTLFERLLTGDLVPTGDRRETIRPQRRGFGRRGVK